MHDEINSRTHSPMGQSTGNPSFHIQPQEISSTSPSWETQDLVYAALDSLEDPMAIKDRYHRWMWANQAFYRLSGVSGDRLGSLSDWVAVGSESAEVFWQRDEAVLQTGEASLHEETLVDSQGKVRFFSTKRSRGRDPAGNPLLTISLRELHPHPNQELLGSPATYQTEQWLKWTIEHLPQAVFWKNRHSVYLGCNPKFAQMVKLQHPEEIIGKTDRDLPWKLEDLETIQRWDTQILEHQIPERHRLEIQPLSPDSSIFLNLYQVPLQNEDGVAIGILGTVEDVTDRKQIDKALRDYHNELLTIFGAMQDVIIVLDREGCYLRIVPTNTSHLYKPESELIGKTLHEVFSGETADWFLETIRQTLFHQQTIGIEYCLLVNETEVWFEASIAPLREDEVIWVARDITQRKQAELSNQETQQRLQAILDYAPAIIFIKDLEGKYLILNHQIRQLFNLIPEDCLGKTDRELFPEKVARKFQEHDRQTLRLNTPTPLEHKISVGEREYTYLTLKFPLKNAAGKTYAIGGISTDITERKQAEDQLQQKTKLLEKTLLELRQTQAQLILTEKMSSLGQLVAGIAHEINNPINFIHANLNHARMYIDDLFDLLHLYQERISSEFPEIQAQLEEMDWEFVRVDLPKLLGSMQVGTQRIRNIVRSLRTFSRLDETGLKRADLHEGIESTLMMLQHRLTAKPGCPEIEVIRDYGELPVVECDAGQLNQVFLNILTNAIDALEEAIVLQECTEPTISIRTAVLTADRLGIYIANNGPHIPEEVQQRLFDPFFTTKPVGKGTGIGMSICYQIVTERHQGSLQCVSAPGEGVQFTIELPICQTR